MTTFISNLFYALSLQLEHDTHGRNVERVYRDGSGRLRRRWMAR